MTSYPLGFRLAQAVGLTGAAWLSGKSTICFCSARRKAIFADMISTTGKRDVRGAC